MSIPRWCQHILGYHGVPYTELHHPPVFSASRLAHAEHVSGRRVAKTVLLKAWNRPVAVVLPACARLDLGRVQAVLGAEDLRLASEAEVAGWFKGCRPGCVPPLRLRNDELLLMDRSLAHLREMVFAAGTPEDAVAVRFRDWFRAARPGVGCFARPAGAGAAPEPPTVLVVEDEADTNQLLCRLLEREGVVCHGVEGGNEALAAAQQVRPTAILLDLMLPDMSGFEMYERLQRNEPSKHIPCIVMTALDDEASRRRGEQLGVDAYLTKPFRPRALVTELQDILADTRS
jgi:CheY-like chemotaxis protein/prolyl-tRNA editing enzyme YbaK/EbsC (Cys-tRNA(Pro) deacylase)